MRTSDRGLWGKPPEHPRCPRCSRCNSIAVHLWHFTIEGWEPATPTPAHHGICNACRDRLLAAGGGR